MFRWLFSKVTFTCTHCGARQRMPLRRVRFFERFHGLTCGQVVLIGCPDCRHGLQIPTHYQTHTGHETRLDPHNPKNAIIHHG